MYSPSAGQDLYSNVTLTGNGAYGTATGSSTTLVARGGGLQVVGSGLTLASVKLVGNYAVVSGGSPSMSRAFGGGAYGGVFWFYACNVTANYASGCKVSDADPPEGN